MLGTDLSSLFWYEVLRRVPGQSEASWESGGHKEEEKETEEGEER